MNDSMIPGQPRDEAAKPLPRTAQTKRVMIIGGVAAVLLVGIIVAIMLLTGGKGVGFRVGEHPYLYACQTLDRTTIAKELGFSTDNKSSVLEVSARDFAKTNADLRQLTGEVSADSTCTYRFNLGAQNNDSLAGDSVELYLTQFQDNKAATGGAMVNKPQYAKDLPSGKEGDSAYYAVANEDQDPNKTVADGSVVRGNYEMFVRLRLKTPLSEASYKQKLETLLAKALGTIEAGSAQGPLNLAGVAKIGGEPFVDLCTQVDYAKLSDAMGGVEFKPTKISASSDDSEVKLSHEPAAHFNSRCLLAFRTAPDKAAQQGVTIAADATDQRSAFDLRFIQLLTVGVEQYATPADSAAAMAAGKTTLSTPAADGYERPPLRPVTLGEEAFMSQQNNDATGQGGAEYFIRQGKNIMRLTVSYKKQSKPFKSDGYALTDEIAGRIVGTLQAARERK